MYRCQQHETTKIFIGKKTFEYAYANSLFTSDRYSGIFEVETISMVSHLCCLPKRDIFPLLNKCFAHKCLLLFDINS